MIIVISTGRSGTNLALEILSGQPYFVTSEYEEDKYVTHRDMYYPDNLLTKTDTHYIPTVEHLLGFMDRNKTTKLVWTVRHPYDWVMSKVYRGWGGADDATFQGCIDDMYWSAKLYKNVLEKFENRVITVKMEDMILNIELEANRMCNFLDVPLATTMLKPWERMRNLDKKERYPDKLYTDQVGLYKNWKTIYNGFLATKIDFNMEDLFKEIKPLLAPYGYEDK